eukprot:SAG31_NODE_1264_length_9071_cov_17.828132_4_plen_1309_part_00
MRQTANLMSHATPNLVGNPAYYDGTDVELGGGSQMQDDADEIMNPASYDDMFLQEVWRSPTRFRKRHRVCCCLNGRASSYWKSGQSSLKKGRLHEAELAFRQALHMDPPPREAAYVQCLLGKMFAEAERLEEARDCFDDAIKCCADYSPAHYNMGRLLHRLGKADESVGHFDKCLDIDPADNDARRGLTLALSDLDRPQEAIRHVRAAIKGTEEAMNTNSLTLGFKSAKLEKEFQERRARRSAGGTRLLLLMGLLQQLLLVYYEEREGEDVLEAGLQFIEDPLSIGVKQKGNMTHYYDATGHQVTSTRNYDALHSSGGDIHAVDPINGESVDLLDPTDLPGKEITGPEMMEERLLEWLNAVDHDKTFLILDALTIFLTGLCLLITFHKSFFRFKHGVLTIEIILFVFLQLVQTTFLLIESDLHYEEKQEVLVAVPTELIETIMTTHIHFSLLLAFPQIFGLRWIRMFVICICILLGFVGIWDLFPSSELFFPPVYVAVILAFVCITAFWVESFERQWFKTAKLLVIQKECVAQYQRDWRRSEQEKHDAEIDVVQARAALRTRNQMTAFIFHEIRNPLNAMLGAIQMIATTVQTVKERKWAQIAINTMGMVSNVLNDVLFLSKIEEGKVTLHKHSFSITAMIEEITFMFSEQAEQKCLSLICESHPATTVETQNVVGDEGRLKEVLANFCSNAIKFTEAGSVTLIVEQVADHGTSVDLDIHVTDTGCGLSQENQLKLFSPFETLRDKETNRGPRGTGLGLAISKHIVAAHGGEVYVESQGEGHGSRFGFRVRLDKSESPANSDLEDGSDGADELKDVHLLLVDDDEFNLEVVHDMLSSVGWRCDTANNGTEALRLLSIPVDSGGQIPSVPSVQAASSGRTRYDCVITDQIMPVISGRELTRRIRSSLASAEAPPVIGLTGSAQVEDIDACKTSGMCTVLTKPVRLGDLVNAVRDVIKADRQRQQQLESANEQGVMTVVFDCPGTLGITWEVDADSDEEEGSEDSEEITISAVLPNSLAADMHVIKPGMVLKCIGSTEVRIPPMTFEDIIYRMCAHRSKENPLTLTLKHPRSVAQSRHQRSADYRQNSTIGSGDRDVMNSGAGRATSGSTTTPSSSDSQCQEDPWRCVCTLALSDCNLKHTTDYHRWHAGMCCSRGALTLTPSKTGVAPMMVPALKIEPRQSLSHMHLSARRGSNEWWNNDADVSSLSPGNNSKRGGSSSNSGTGWNWPPKPPSAGKKRQLSSPTPHGGAGGCTGTPGVARASPQRMSGIVVKGRKSPVPSSLHRADATHWDHHSSVVPDYRHSVGENFS